MTEMEGMEEVSELGVRLVILEEARSLGVTSVDLPLIAVQASEAIRDRRADEA